MEALIKRKTEQTPEIIMDKEKGVFKIVGISLSERATSMYEEVIDWLNKYFESPNEKTVLDIDLDYMNSASVLNIARILKIVKDNYEKGADVMVNWYYQEDDLEMEESGAELADLFQIKLKLIKK